MNSHDLPRTDSIHELAEFWDTHDLTEFESELEEVKEPTFERETRISVQLHQPRRKQFTKLQDPRALPIRN